MTPDTNTRTPPALVLNFRAMHLPHADLSYIEQQLSELASQVWEGWESAGGADRPDSPLLLRDALQQLLRHLDRVQQDREGDNPTELSALGEYGLHLIDELATIAARLELTDLAKEICGLCLPFALWTARNGGEIRNLKPVVNAFAEFANRQAEPHVMAGLYACCCELIDAASPTCEEEQDPENPWRLLLLNRAIVATRSHNLELMVAAFDAIVEQLPADAEGFFSQGMEQIALIDYPDSVGDVIQRYFLAHTKPKQLH